MYGYIIGLRQLKTYGKCQTNWISAIHSYLLTGTTHFTGFVWSCFSNDFDLTVNPYFSRRWTPIRLSLVMGARREIRENRTTPFPLPQVNFLSNFRFKVIGKYDIWYLSTFVCIKTRRFGNIDQLSFSLSIDCSLQNNETDVWQWHGKRRRGEKRLQSSFKPYWD